MLIHFGFIIILVFNPVSPQEVKLNELYDLLWLKNSSPESIKSALWTITKSFMNLSVNPCDDFYTYACGNWEKHNVRSTLQLFNVDSVLRRRLMEELLEVLKMDIGEYLTRTDRYILENEDNSTNNFAATIAEIKAMHIFQSCINVDLIKQRGAQPAIDFFHTFEGFPVGPGDDNDFNWLNLTAQLRLLNQNVFFGLNVKKFKKNVFELFLDPGTLVLGDLKVSTTLDYGFSQCEFLDKTRVIEVLKFMQVDNSSGFDYVREIFDLERKLRDIPRHPFPMTGTLEDFKEELPGVDWAFYIQTVLGLSESDDVYKYSINVGDFRYLKGFINLVSTIPKGTLKRYLFFRLGYAIKPLTEFQDSYSLEEIEDRAYDCYTDMEPVMEIPLNAIFLRNFFTTVMEEDVTMITQDIFFEFFMFSFISDWFHDDDLKEKLAFAVLRFDVDVGYKGKEGFYKALQNNYTNLEIEPKKYFENTLNLWRHRVKMEQNTLGTSYKVGLMPLQVNAAYNAQQHLITVLAGILQPPFYHPDFPKWAKYGGFGTKFGHEAYHAFDIKNILEQMENLQNSFIKYFVQLLCLVRQYGNYGLTNIEKRIDGLRTINENFSDNGGISIAYSAYKSWLNQTEDAEDEIIPGLDLTPEQLFFVSFAQMSCDASSAASNRIMIDTDEHTPGQFRVIGTLSNSNDFAEAFACPVNSIMNPSRKCKLD